jgi:hypothetical protein
MKTMKTVWVYTDTSKQVGDPNQLHVFATKDSAIAWIEEFDPESVWEKGRQLRRPFALKSKVEGSRPA